MGNDIYLTDREADVMQVLWDHGPSVVNEVKEKLHDELAYTTVLTILRTLERAPAPQGQAFQGLLRAAVHAPGVRPVALEGADSAHEGPARQDEGEVDAGLDAVRAHGHPAAVDRRVRGGTRGAP